MKINNNEQRVCLIIPPSPFLLDERVFMSLGILSIAAVLEKAAMRVEVMDLSGVSNFKDVVKDHMRYFPKDGVWGFTATTPQLPSVIEMVDLIKQTRSDIKTIIGGPHVTLVNAAYKHEMYHGTINGRAAQAMKKLENAFDVLLAGDGEEAIFLTLEHNLKEKLIDADNTKSPLFLNNARFNGLPFPARHLIDIESYRYSIDGFPALSLITQLGCPFNCGFCGGRESPMLRKIRVREPESVVEEMVHLYKATGRRGFMLYDDELNVNKRMVSLMELITKAQKDLKTEWRLRGFIKSELFTSDQARAMRDAGFRWILVGFESGSPGILKNINKKATREQNSNCVYIARENELKVKALMSIGHPGESAETIRDTEKWLLETRPNDFDVTIITCYPGTSYYDKVVPHSEKQNVWTYTSPKSGDKLHQIGVDYTKISDYYKGKPDGGYKSYVFTDYISGDELISERDRIERNVRKILKIPYNPSSQAVQYEHSMGQSGIPSNILRITKYK